MKRSFVACLCFLVFGVKANAPALASFINANTLTKLNSDYNGKIEARHKTDKICRYYMHDARIYSMGLDTLANIQFWRKAIALSPDSGYINVASSRSIIATIPVAAYNKMTDVQKDCYRDSIRSYNGLSENEKIVFTTGRKHFYLLENVMKDITKVINIFEQNNTDPFYAQTILLIESPGKLSKSSVGAYGPFQLMKSVARNMGLTVNKYVDERANLERAAYAAAKLIRTICIPYTNAMLDAKGICYDQNELWYRLLVLHVYHAGAGNVAKALNALQPTEGGMELIKKLWNTHAGAFKTASQSYSQVALACLIELDLLINKHCEEIAFIELTD